eukprot:tig00001355_g8340.t1
MVDRCPASMNRALSLARAGGSSLSLALLLAFLALALPSHAQTCGALWSSCSACVATTAASLASPGGGCKWCTTQRACSPIADIFTCTGFSITASNASLCADTEALRIMTPDANSRLRRARARAAALPAPLRAPRRARRTGEPVTFTWRGSLVDTPRAGQALDLLLYRDEPAYPRRLVVGVGVPATLAGVLSPPRLTELAAASERYFAVAVRTREFPVEAGAAAGALLPEAAVAASVPLQPEACSSALAPAGCLLDCGGLACALPPLLPAANATEGLAARFNASARCDDPTASPAPPRPAPPRPGRAPGRR